MPPPSQFPIGFCVQEGHRAAIHAPPFHCIRFCSGSLVLAASTDLKSTSNEESMFLHSTYSQFPRSIACETTIRQTPIAWSNLSKLSKNCCFGATQGSTYNIAYNFGPTSLYKHFFGPNWHFYLGTKVRVCSLRWITTALCSAANAFFGLAPCGFKARPWQPFTTFHNTTLR